MSDADRLMQAWQALEDLSIELPQRELIQRGVDIAQAVTQSRIAYLHYLNDDQNSIELGAWSTETRALCSASYDRHYPVAAAGIWADTARTGMPCVHNNYGRVEQRRGLPEGHAALQRHLGVPVVEQGRVRLLVGVGNKAQDYDEADITALSLVARRIWSLVRQRRLVEHHLDTEHHYRQVQQLAAVCGWEYDIGEDRLHFDEMFGRLFRLPPGNAAPQNLAQWLEHVDPGDHQRLREALDPQRGGSRRVLRIACRSGNGGGFAAELKIEFRPREVGQGQVVIGILKDLWEQLLLDDLRRRAETDALTGLPNRNRLQAEFDLGRAGRRGERDHLAFHYIDLDGFKPINDLLGHAAGDEVLRTVAKRLRQSLRKGDLAARIGGDEFAVVQGGLRDAQAAAALAEKIIASLSTPITVQGRQVKVGASVGIALCTDPGVGLQEVAAAADRALYKAKAAGGGRWELASPGDDAGSG